MALFNMHYDRPGPGVDPDTPRKKGAARLLELLGRDLSSFWMAGLLTMLSTVPFLFGIWFSLVSHAVLPALLAGVVGGAIAAPQICGMQDAMLRSLRDEPGYWWHTYRRVWKRNAKAALLPGALGGLILAMQIFTIYHMAGQGVGLLILLFVGLFFLTGLAQYVFAQIVLLELPFGGVIKNAVLLFLGFLPRTVLGIVWQLAYWGLIALFWPISSVLLVITGCWLPTLLSLMAIYPALDKSFHVEETVKKMRDGEDKES